MATKRAVPGENRRTFLRTSALGLFAYQLAGCEHWLSPAEAREKSADLKVFAAPDGQLLEQFGEALVPGALKAGLLHYIDANLQRPQGQSLLTARYLDIATPHAAFYLSGLKALAHYARTELGKDFGDATPAEQRRLIGPMLGDRLPGWDGPPAALFYLAVRSDAADLVYGTVSAFERMQIPYMAHIEPRSDW